jgi:hypothetical protein
MTIHSDSTSAIARAGRTGAGPGQEIARNIRMTVSGIRDKSATLVWVKGREGTPGNGKANALEGRTSKKTGYSEVMSIAHLKPRISKRFTSAKEAQQKVDKHHGTKEIPPPVRSPAWTTCGTRWPTRCHQSAPATGDPPYTLKGSTRWRRTDVCSAKHLRACPVRMFYCIVQVQDYGRPVRRRCKGRPPEEYGCCSPTPGGSVGL